MPARGQAGAVLRRDGTIDPAGYEVDQDGCHIWLGRVTAQGRPEATKSSRRELVHQWIVNADPHRLVKTTCGKPLCVRPDHLELVPSAAEEAAALLARMPLGTELDQERDVLEMFAAGMSSREIGDRLGIERAAAYGRIETARHRVWRYVTRLERESREA